MTKVNEKIYKFFKTKAVSIDESKKTIRFRISDNKPDRMGEIVDQKSWDFKSYKTNPLVLWGHKSDEPENVLGTGVDLETTDDGSETFATLQLDEDISPKASLVWKQLVKGTLRCVSVGFIPHTLEWLDDDPVLKDNELFEISIVPIPANPRAVALDFKAGSISRKDADWLMSSMRKEADLIENQLAVPSRTEKSMSDEQAAALIEGMSQLTETVNELKADNQALRDEIAADKKSREDEAAKTEEERKAAEEEAARKAEEDANKDDPAKGGDDDQPGAGTSDSIDDDTELTPELQAQIDAELEAEDSQQ